MLQCKQPHFSWNIYALRFCHFLEVTLDISLHVWPPIRNLDERILLAVLVWVMQCMLTLLFNLFSIEDGERTALGPFNKRVCSRALMQIMTLFIFFPSLLWRWPGLPFGFGTYVGMISEVSLDTMLFFWGGEFFL
jgi:hypothetical protein